MPRTYLTSTAENEEKIRHLERELDAMRWDIINLMPEQKRKILMSFFHCESRSETYLWQDTISDQLVGTAEVISSVLGDRAYCPLCGDGSSSGYVGGYSIPIGLTRHLTGWGNIRRCTVVAAASAIARDHWNEKFAPAERTRDATNAALVAKRKDTETLFLNAPNGEPCLLDERLYSGTARTAEEMTWAEQRLRDLGFGISIVGRVKSYIDEREEIVVYADPRAKGRINFTAYLRKAPKKAARPQLNLRHIGTYYIQDTWKNDLSTKYQGWVARLPG